MVEQRSPKSLVRVRFSLCLGNGNNGNRTCNRCLRTYRYVKTYQVEKIVSKKRKKILIVSLFHAIHEEREGNNVIT